MDPKANYLTLQILFNIIVIICEVQFESLLYIFKVYQTVMHSLRFGTLQIIIIIKFLLISFRFENGSVSSYFLNLNLSMLVIKKKRKKHVKMKGKD